MKMYLIFLEFIKKPSNIVIVTLSVLLTLCFINSQLKDIKISSLKNEIKSLNQEIEQIEQARKVEKDLYEHNIKVVKQAFSELQLEVEKLKDVIKQKNEELAKQGDRVEHWKKLYSNKQCVNNDQEIVKPTQGIINDETNFTIITSVNNIFGF